MAETYEPYATKEDVQALRGDLLERIGRLEGQMMILVRLQYLIAGSVLAMAIKVIFFP
jgi:hypothetical protein